MVQIEFDFNQRLTIIQANLDDPFKEVIKLYIQKTFLNPDQVCFLTNGRMINPENKVEELMTSLNKSDKKMKVLVTSKEDDNKEPVLIKSKEVICPKCQEPCRIKIENYKIKLYDCINNHITENIELNKYQETQKIDISKIVCDICKKQKENTQENNFFICLNCKHNVCLLCRTIHNPNHNIIKYEQKNYICNKHNESYIKYCNDCKINLCFICEEKHKNDNIRKAHNIISLSNLIIDADEIKKKINEIKTNIESFKTKIKSIIQELTDLIKLIEIYYEINNDILKNYEIQKRNFYNLQNINEMSLNNQIFEEIKEINDNKNINNQILNIIYLYYKITLNKEKNNIFQSEILNQMKNYE